MPYDLYIFRRAIACRDSSKANFVFYTFNVELIQTVSIDRIIRIKLELRGKEYKYSHRRNSPQRETRLLNLIWFDLNNLPRLIHGDGNANWYTVLEKSLLNINKRSYKSFLKEIV